MSTTIPGSGKAGGGFSRILIIFLLLAGAALFFWKTWAVGNLERQLVVQRETLIDLSARALTDQADEMLRLAAVPMGWAVRSELLKGNLEQIDDYFRRYVREANITGVVLVDDRDSILVATDKKLEGTPGSAAFPADLLAISQTTTDTTSAGVVRTAVPIMGFDSRMGTLVFTYSTAGIDARVKELQAPSAKQPD